MRILSIVIINQQMKKTYFADKSFDSYIVTTNLPNVICYQMTRTYLNIEIRGVKRLFQVGDQSLNSVYVDRSK